MMALHYMGRRQNDDRMAAGGGGGGGGASSSSIALLQERFRQLQKMRERREEMELLKLFSESETMSRTKCYDRSGNSLTHPEMVRHKQHANTRSSFQDSLSLGLDLYGMKEEHQPSKTDPPFTDFLSMGSLPINTSRSGDKYDVDTSLHL
ncbi:hypothetical protein QVD17_30158 [Tagetes erecta]|uniref:Uncharacterized protein n=1 Tax=Tagetes erecta TaxID=13708 RepID=A0AAD8K109_TARER|nr:hypothetical protein QVD17_30158 [Tagetes erecta]